MNLWEFLDNHVGLTPEKLALTDDLVAETYQQLFDQSVKASNALHSIGVSRGDVVAMMMNNSAEYLHIWFAIARLGAVCVPVNVHIKGDGLTYILSHSHASAIVFDESLADRISVARKEIPSMRCVAVGSSSAVEGFEVWRKLVNESDRPAEVARVSPEEVAALLYTSGTTGPPKGVMLSHRAYLNSAKHFSEEMVGASSEDVLHTSLPLFHINAQAHTALPAIYCNASISLIGRFSASKFWSEIAEREATIFNSLGAMIPILLKQPPDESDRTHGARVTACAATPAANWREFEERFGVQIVEGYGLTETTGFCVCNPRGASRVGSMGKVMAFVEARIVDQMDEECSTGELGEIALCAAVPHVFMEGYHEMPEQTAQAMRGGWFHTGDIGHKDEEGYLYFADRLKESIRRRGENISSFEVEQIINAHPHVLESAAVGVPSELGEEDVMVWVVLRPGKSLDFIDLISWCETRMAYFMVPRYVKLIDELPKTPTERIEKYKLKEGGTEGAWDREQVGYRITR